MIPTARIFLVVALAAGLAACATIERAMAPDAELRDDHWTAFRASSVEEVDHGAWGRFLERYLRVQAGGVNRVAYGAVDSGGRALLDGYIEALAGTRVTALNRDQQLAYWINLYNAVTVRLILDHYPLESIMDIGISPGFLAFGPWGAARVTVEGRALSLDDIEHHILRPVWRDPRLHYALNCASVGCPNLGPAPYRSATLEAQLEAAAVAYVNDPRGVRQVRGGVVLSKIYSWFREDFGAGDDFLRAHLARYARGEVAELLAARPAIKGYAYDWSLNDAP